MIPAREAYREPTEGRYFGTEKTRIRHPAVYLPFAGLPESDEIGCLLRESQTGIS